ncbi:hypothetical protein GCM10022255_000080 [Dactylosporangium darangshiense]|uniref:HTH lysR-type domain-containing protein n=1 Tax=Dactylosporangium darangshiense TaxID=579108 RepID=A0ABP8CT93_9ACTN
MAPNEWECKVFIAVADHGSYLAAAEHLSRQIGRSYTRRAVNQVIKKIEAWLKTPPFEGTHSQKKLTPRGEEFRQAALNILAGYQRMRNEGPAPALPTLACLPHHVYLMTAMEPPKIIIRYLESRHGAPREFRDHAVHLLHTDVYQLIVGPPIADDRALVSKELYTARLLAMVPRSFRSESVRLADLLADYELLLPRQLLEAKIDEWALEDAYKHATITEDEAATAILRMRNEPATANRVVVAPSDVALAYTTGHDFAGEGADRFRWVPITHQRRYLEYPVAVTTRKTEAAKLFPVIAALRDAVAQVPGYTRLTSP